MVNSNQKQQKYGSSKAPQIYPHLERWVALDLPYNIMKAFSHFVAELLPALAPLGIGRSTRPLDGYELL